VSTWALRSPFFTPKPQVQRSRGADAAGLSEEFYTRPLPSKIPELQRELDSYLNYYNRERPHRALGGLAPLEYLARMQEESVPRESQMC